MRLFRLVLSILLQIDIFTIGCSGLLVAQDSHFQLIVLGNLQDGGRPHMGCRKICCTSDIKQGSVTSLALVRPNRKGYILFEATPDIVSQTGNMARRLGGNDMPEAIFLTHAHMGHYAGLLQLGREAMNTRDLPIFAMPKMKSFLEANGPWQQLVSLRNIQLRALIADTTVMMNGLSVTPFLVPHRDEYSETVGFKINGPKRTVLFIPDINKWHLWNKCLAAEIEKVDIALIDGTFFADGEVDRPMSEIPHPFIVETMSLLDREPLSIRQKVFFIHLNHTNPLLDPAHPSVNMLATKGYRVAREGDVFGL